MNEPFSEAEAKLHDISIALFHLRDRVANVYSKLDDFAYEHGFMNADGLLDILIELKSIEKSI